MKVSLERFNTWWYIIFHWRDLPLQACYWKHALPSQIHIAVCNSVNIILIFCEIWTESSLLQGYCPQLCCCDIGMINLARLCDDKMLSPVMASCSREKAFLICWASCYICYYICVTHWPLGDLNEIFDQVIFKQGFVISGWGISPEIALRWMSLDLIDDKSTWD